MEKILVNETIKDKLNNVEKELSNVTLEIFHSQALCKLIINYILPDIGVPEVELLDAVASAALNSCNEIEKVYCNVFREICDISKELEKGQSVAV